MSAEPPRDRPGRSPARPPVRFEPGFGLVFDLGLRLVVSVLLGLGLGLLLSDWLGLPIMVLFGVLLGAAAAMYTIWDVARQAFRR